MKKLFTVLTVLLSAVSAVTTWQGLVLENRFADSWINRGLVPTLVAISVGSLAIIFWIALFKRYPQMDIARKRTFNYLIIPAICLFILIASTIYSVIGIGGVSALTAHMYSSISTCEQEVSDLGLQVEKDNNLISPVEMLAVQFESLSNLEKNDGITTGITGNGAVTIQLMSLSSTLNNLKKIIQESVKDRRENLREVSDKMIRIKEAINNPEEKLEIKLAKFSNQIVGINQLLMQVSTNNVSALVKEVSKKLEDLSATAAPQGNGELQKAQTAGLERIKTSISSARKILDAYCNNDGQIRIETMENLSMIQAVGKYWFLVWPQLAVALALDFTPLVLLIFLVVTKKEEDIEQATENALLLSEQENK